MSVSKLPKKNETVAEEMFDVQKLIANTRKNSPNLYKNQAFLERMSLKATELYYGIMMKDEKILAKYNVDRKEVSIKEQRAAASEILNTTLNGARLQMQLERHAVDIVDKEQIIKEREDKIKAGIIETDSGDVIDFAKFSMRAE